MIWRDQDPGSPRASRSGPAQRCSRLAPGGAELFPAQSRVVRGGAARPGARSPAPSPRSSERGGAQPCSSPPPPGARRLQGCLGPRCEQAEEEQPVFCSQGGVDDEISLTAYITAALLELHLEKNGTMVDDALLCLKKASHDVNSTYAQALMAYVFTLAKDMETRQQLLEPLSQQADQLGEDSPQKDDEDSSEEVAEDSSLIETVAYILLAHISKPEVSAEEIAATSQIVRWLTKRQNSYGGFASTQDTVVALQALARYAALTYHEAEGVKVTVKSKEGSQQEFHVDKKNQLVLQQASLHQVPGEYVVQAVGNGCVYVQTTLRYNVPPPESKATFVLDVKTVPEECNCAARKRFELHVQVSYIGDRESSNMALIEVMMLSGFIPVKKSLKKLEKMPLVKKTEVEPSKLTIYLEELDKSPVSFKISVKKEIEVQNLKPATVTVYDYYQPGDSAITEYNAPCSSDV